MKTKELNKEIVNLYHNKNKNIYVEESDGKVYISDSYVVWILDKNDFIFDINAFKSCKIKSIVESVTKKELVDAIKSNQYTKENSLTLISLMNEEHAIKVNINEKYLKCFEDNCTFKVVNETSPVLVYENKILVGIIMPVKSF